MGVSAPRIDEPKKESEPMIRQSRLESLIESLVNIAIDTPPGQPRFDGDRMIPGLHHGEALGYSAYD